MDALTLASALGQTWSGPVANDWLSFYTGGTLVRTGNAAHLYDASAQSVIQHGLLGAHFKAPLGFLLPVFVAALLAPLTNLSLALSYTVWLLINTALLSLLAWLGWRWLKAVPTRLRLVFLVSVVTLPGAHVLTHGQFDLFVLAGLAGCYALLRAGRNELGGIVLALALCKPHLAGSVVLLLLVKRQWRALAAFAGAGGALMLAPSLFLGPGVLLDQTRLLFSFNSATTNDLALPLVTMINIRATVTSLTGSSNIWLWLPPLVCVTAVAFAAALRVWVAHPALHPQSWALAFALPLLYSPHVHVQSLVLLAASAGLFLATSQASPRPIVDFKLVLAGLVVVAMLWSLSIGAGVSLMSFAVIASYAFFSLRWPEPAAIQTLQPAQLALAS